jgi:hypothetical protein
VHSKVIIYYHVTGALVDLHFSSAEVIKLDGNKTAVVITVPYRMHKRFQKIQRRLISELQKKLDKTSFIIVAQKTIITTETPTHTIPTTSITPPSITAIAESKDVTPPSDDITTDDVTTSPTRPPIPNLPIYGTTLPPRTPSDDMQFSDTLVEDSSDDNLSSARPLTN